MLVVDDDEAIRDSVSIALRDEGFLVDTATNGLHALNWMRAHPGEVDIVLLDLMMPVMDGRTFLKLKEKDPLTADVPVVVITASHERDRVLRGHNVRECLGKPVSLETLLRAVTASTSIVG